MRAWVCILSAMFGLMIPIFQVTPALLCTFRQLPPSAVITVPTYLSTAPNFKHDIGDCMKMCYEDPSCVYVISFKAGPCSINPSTGISVRVDEVHYDNVVGGDVYQLDRNETVMECPKLEE
ncbi:hypothetical protein OSTOST_20085, partial [Ostertagia ostertagi]